MGMFMLLPILLLGGGLGGSNELLDFAQTEAYWKAKNVTVSAEALVAMIDAKPKADDISALIKQLGHDDFDKREEATAAIAKKGPGVIPQLKEATKSTDAEVADRANRLIAELSGGDTDPAVHKLMIIRTLGELKDKSALPALKALADSKEPFVATYANRAIASIEGKPFTSPTTSAATFEKDLWTLPKEVKLVSQMTMTGSGPVNFAKALEGLALPPGAGVPDKETLVTEMQKGVLTALNHVGNVRIDGVTMGLSGDPDNASGFVIILARGQYSREKAIATFKKMGQTVEDVEGTPTMTAERGSMNLLMVSDEMIAIVGGPPGTDLPVKQTLAAIKAGKGTLDQDADMVALLKQADRKTGGWAVAHMTETYKSGAPWMKAFDTVVAHRTTEKGKTTFKIVGAGKDADAVADAVNQMNAGLDETRKMFAQIPAGSIPQPMVDFMNSLKIEAKDGKATLTGAMEGSFESIMGSMLMPWMSMRAGGF